MSTEPNKGDIVERCKRTASAMSRTSPDSGIDICHITTVNEAAAEIRALRERVAKLERSEDQLIGERDDAEEALSQAYFLVIGESAEWSNFFGHKEALEAIDDAQTTLRETIRELRSQVADLTAQRDAMAGIADPAAYIDNSHGAFRRAARLDEAEAEIERLRHIEEAARAYLANSGVMSNEGIAAQIELRNALNKKGPVNP